MKIRWHLLLVLIALGWAQPGFTQSNPYSAANRAVQISQARHKNAALMHSYLWNSRIEIIKDNQVKDTRIQQVSYSPTGQLQTTLLNDKPASSGMMLPTPLGFLMKSIADNEKQELEQFLKGLKAMLEQYTLPTTGKILDFLSKVTPTGPDGNGMFQLTGHDVVQPGDSMTMWVNPHTKHPTQIKVNTTFQGDTVQVSATFATLHSSGLNYAAFAEATVPAKKLSVKVHNYNYARLSH